jgi:hypothetical protein
MLQSVICSFVVRNCGKTGQKMWKVRFQSSAPQGEDDVSVGRFHRTDMRVAGVWNIALIRE